MREEQPMLDDGWDGVHLGEATAHAWLDGALPPDEAARAEAHVATCADCTALVAEARGLIAGASRILGALDAVPAGVLPAGVLPAGTAPVVPARAPRRWWTGVPARAAAALLLVAGGSAVVLRERGGDPAPAAASRVFEIAEPRAVADSAAVAPPAAASAAAPEAAPEVAPASPRVATARRAARAVAADAALPAAPPAPMAAPVAAPMAAPVAAPMPAPPAPVGVAGGVARGEARRDVAAKATAAAADAMVAEQRAAAPARVQSLVENVAAAAGVIAGRVVSADGRPLAAAQVQIVGTATGATTDSTGAFRLRSPAPGPATLQARRIGYVSDTARVQVRQADTVATTLVLERSAVSLSAAVVADGATLAARRATARAAVGCWAVRPARGWTAAAPALPDVLRLERAGSDAVDGLASVADEPGRAAWREGRWTVADASAITVTLPATGGEMSLALQRDGRGWRGTTAWTATPATRAAAPVDVRLETTRCPAR